MSEPSGLPARLSRDGRFILCHRIRCDVRFALALGDVTGSGTPLAGIFSGWHYSDDANEWRMSSHAKGRLMKGLPPRDRRPPMHSEWVRELVASLADDLERAAEIVPEMADQFLEAKRTTVATFNRLRSTSVEMWQQYRTAVDLLEVTRSVAFACPKCGTRSIMTVQTFAGCLTERLGGADFTWPG